MVGVEGNAGRTRYVRSYFVNRTIFRSQYGDN